MPLHQRYAAFNGCAVARGRKLIREMQKRPAKTGPAIGRARLLGHFLVATEALVNVVVDFLQDVTMNDATFNQLLG